MEIFNINIGQEMKIEEMVKCAKTLIGHTATFNGWKDSMTGEVIAVENEKIITTGGKVGLRRFWNQYAGGKITLK